MCRTCCILTKVLARQLVLQQSVSSAQRLDPLGLSDLGTSIQRLLNFQVSLMSCWWRAWVQPGRLLDNSRIRQLADCQLAEWTTRGLDISRTGQLADATRDFACLSFVLLAIYWDRELSSPRKLTRPNWSPSELCHSNFTEGQMFYVWHFTNAEQKKLTLTLTLGPYIQTNSSEIVRFQVSHICNVHLRSIFQFWCQVLNASHCS